VSDNSEKKWSYDISIETFLKNFFQKSKKRLILAFEWQEKCIELKNIEALMEVIKAIVQLSQFVKHFSVFVEQGRNQLSVEIIDACEDYLPVFSHKRFATYC